MGLYQWCIMCGVALQEEGQTKDMAGGRGDERCPVGRRRRKERVEGERGKQERVAGACRVCQQGGGRSSEEGSSPVRGWYLGWLGWLAHKRAGKEDLHNLPPGPRSAWLEC